MEINNTYTSLIADLPYPSKKSDSDSKGEEVSLKDVEIEVMPSSFDTILEEKQQEDKDSTSVNILV